jgi:hypothetical protein
MVVGMQSLQDYNCWDAKFLQDYDCWDAKFYKIMVVGMQVGSWSYCFHQVKFRHILDNTN